MITLFQVNKFLNYYFLLIFGTETIFSFVIFIGQSFRKIKVLYKILMMF